MKEWVEHYNERAKLSSDPVFVAEMNWESDKKTQTQMTADTNHLLELLNPKQDSSLLDLGCCSGNSVGMVKHHFSSVTGIDMAQSALDLAKKNHADVTFICDDITQIKSIKDHSFSHILAFGVIHYLNDHEIKLLFLRMRQILKPSGKIVLGRIANKNYFKKYQVYRKKNGKTKKDAFELKSWHWIEIRKLEILAQHHGFKVTKILEGDSKLPLQAFSDMVLIKN